MGRPEDPIATANRSVSSRINSSAIPRWRIESVNGMGAFPRGTDRRMLALGRMARRTGSALAALVAGLVLITGPLVIDFALELLLLDGFSA